MAVTNMRIQVRRDSAEMWDLNGDNVLLEGEIGFEVDANKMKIGDGSSEYRELPYFAGGIQGVLPNGGLVQDGAGNISLGEITEANVELIDNGDSTGSLKDHIVDGNFDIVFDPATFAVQQDANVVFIDIMKSLKGTDAALEGRVETLETDIVALTNSSAQGLLTESTIRENADANLAAQDSAILSTVSALSDSTDQSVALINSSLSTLDTRLTAAEGDIVDLRTDLTTSEGNIGDLQTDVATLQQDVLDLDAKIGTLVITGLTDAPVYSSDNVTDFVQGLLFTDTWTGGDRPADYVFGTGGDSLLTYIDKATGSLGADIKVIYNPDFNDPNNSTGVLVDQGADINALIVRADALYDATQSPPTGMVADNGASINQLQTDVIALQSTFTTGDLLELNRNTLGTHKGNVNASDDTVAYDAGTKHFYGNLDGNVTGNLAGDVTGNVTGNLDGDVTGDVTGDVKGNLIADDDSVLVDNTAKTFNGVDVTQFATDIAANAQDITDIQGGSLTAVYYDATAVTAYGGTIIAAVDDAAARTVLGLGTAALLNEGATGAALVAAADPATARTTLEVYSSAEVDAAFVDASTVTVYGASIIAAADAAAARGVLQVYSSAEVDAAFVQASTVTATGTSLITASDANAARTTLEVYSSNEVDTALDTKTKAADVGGTGLTAGSASYTQSEITTIIQKLNAVITALNTTT